MIPQRPTHHRALVRDLPRHDAANDHGGGCDVFCSPELRLAQQHVADPHSLNARQEASVRFEMRDGDARLRAGRHQGGRGARTREAYDAVQHVQGRSASLDPFDLDDDVRAVLAQPGVFAGDVESVEHPLHRSQSSICCNSQRCTAGACSSRRG